MGGLVPNAALLGRLADVLAKIAELEVEAEGIKSALRDCGAGEHDINGARFKITPSRRFNVAKAMEFVPKGRRQECLSIAVDPAKVKRLLTAEQVDECMDEHGKAKVTF